MTDLGLLAYHQASPECPDDLLRFNSCGDVFLFMRGCFPFSADKFYCPRFGKHVRRKLKNHAGNRKNKKACTGPFPGLGKDMRREKSVFKREKTALDVGAKGVS